MYREIKAIVLESSILNAGYRMDTLIGDLPVDLYCAICQFLGEDPPGIVEDTIREQIEGCTVEDLLYGDIA